MLRVLVILASLLTGAHFLRAGQLGLAGVSLLGVALTFARRAASLTLIRVFLIAGLAVWGETALRLVSLRQATGQPWMRLLLILGAVLAVHAVALMMTYLKSNAARFDTAEPSAPYALGAFFLTAATLSAVQLMAPGRLLLLERFVPTAGWLEIALLSYYAAVVVEKMADPRSAPVWRRRIWLLFAAVFFSQLFLGLLGFDRFLMTGDLHPPVPAVILAGPLFRGDGFFMLGLFAVTLLLVGPAWCSHLCYVGAFDQLAAGRRAGSLPPNAGRIRVAVLVLSLLAATLMGIIGVSPLIAGISAVAFGAAGIAVMIRWSRRRGLMVHCTLFCPLGLAADLLGKLNPFRVRIADGCTACGQCTPRCPYGALSKADIHRRRPALTCALCGDCLSACKEGRLGYSAGPFHGSQVRSVFLVLVISIHAVFLGVARI